MSDPLTPARVAELRRNSERMLQSLAVSAPYDISAAEMLALIDAAEKLREVGEERDAARQKAMDEMYLRGNQLAAISTVLMSNTPVALASVRIPADHALYTAAFQDAIRAVEREISLRTKLERITSKDTSYGN